MKNKVVFFMNLPSPYRVEFLNQLGQFVDLTVIIQDESSKNRNKAWFSNNYENFHCILLNGNIYKLLNDIKPQIIFNCDYSNINGIIVSLWAKINKVKLIIEADGGIAKNRGFIINRSISYAMKLADLYCSSGKITDEYFLYYGVDEYKIRHFNFSSLTMKEIADNNIVRKLPINKDNVNILYIGQIINRKGIDILLKAISNMDNINLTIIGGKITKGLEKIIVDYNISNVIFHDFMPKSELKKYYKEADIFVLPSREEIWGLVINEAISYNLPFVASNNCVAAKEFSSCGLLFENENVGDLSDKITMLINDDCLYNEKILNMHNINEKYNIENMVFNHIKIIEEML